MDKIDKVLDKLQKIEIAMAVTHERLDNMKVAVEQYDEELEKLGKKVEVHDKIVGGIIIAVSILATMVKFKLI